MKYIKINLIKFNKMDSNEYNELINNYISNNIKICISKCCGYNFMVLMNNYSRLCDLYKYVTQIYSHVSEPILLYLDENHEKMIPNNEILINDYLRYNNIKPYTNINLPIVYKFYLDLCSKHKKIYRQNYEFK